MFPPVGGAVVADVAVLAVIHVIVIGTQRTAAFNSIHCRCFVFFLSRAFQCKIFLNLLLKKKQKNKEIFLFIIFKDDFKITVKVLLLLLLLSASRPHSSGVAHFLCSRLLTFDLPPPPNPHPKPLRRDLSPAPPFGHL